MKIASGVLAATALVLTLGVAASPASACNDKGNCANAPGHNPGHETRGAPGPIAGAGLPVLAIGYGVYWLDDRFHETCIMEPMG